MPAFSTLQLYSSTSTNTHLQQPQSTVTAYLIPFINTTVGDNTPVRIKFIKTINIKTNEYILSLFSGNPYEDDLFHAGCKFLSLLKQVKNKLKKNLIVAHRL